METLSSMLKQKRVMKLHVAQNAANVTGIKKLGAEAVHLHQTIDQKNDKLSLQSRDM